MQRMTAATVLAAAVAMAWAGEAAAACSHENFTGNPNAVTSYRMQVTSGDRCGVRHVTRRYSKSEQRVFPTSRITLNSRPQHGTVSIEGSRVIYASKKGYKGSDTFTYTTQTAPTKSGPGRTYRYQAAVNVY